MTYVGAVPTTGDFKLLDSITTSSTTTFNLRQGGVAVYPQSANHCIVSLNGVIQAPVDAFTIVNDTIVFASSLASSDVINFILVLGNVNDIGVPSSSSVGVSQLSASGSASSSTYLRGDNTWAAAGGDLSFGGDTFGADKTIGSNDAYALSFETNNAVGLKIDNAGHVTKPLQCAFLAKAGAQSNKTGNGTEYTIEFGSAERFDQNADFDVSGATTFTAPVTGKYFLSASVGISGGDSNITYSNLYITTSNQRYDWFGGAAGNMGEGGSFKASQALIADMDANDTAVVKVSAGGMGSDSLDLTDNSYFCGYLVC